MSEEKSYKSTLNLPQTDFPMRANLPQREPQWLKAWQDKDLYGQIHAQAKGREKFILHDGPPYANGAIHLGHILNKTLKDFIVKYRHMNGYDCHYVPGWDCHGLPIEQQVIDQFRAKGKSPPREVILKACAEFAAKWVAKQKEEFIRLGILGDWEHPYRTMDPEYEGHIAREFARVVRGGYVYRGLKPVYWDWKYETALAEAEIEYHDHESPSIYVPFELASPDSVEVDPALRGKKLELVIWTTTPWTLPANLALALNESLDYAAVEVGARVFVVAKDLVANFQKALVIDGAPGKVIATFPATKLTGAKARHPFIDRESLVLFGDFVTLEAGTGCVHIAPGHGEDDFRLGQQHGLPVLCPVDSEGKYTDEFAPMKGEFIFDANEKIKALLVEKGRLLNSPKASLKHSYPHSWRSKEPVIYRATSQWFLSLAHESLRAESLKAIDAIQENKGWIPSWGRDRIYSMLENRPDWTLSRQRVWGVPIPSLECEGCGEVFLDADTCDQVADLIAKDGISIWTTRDVADLVPAGTKCPACGKSQFRKGTDILDVWFDSGVSFAAVCEAREELRFPADLYLEGSDQHRGWFHSSLLASMATRKAPPYKAVLTHGFVVDGEGKKYSKSNPNYQPPAEIIKEYGVDVLRLWVASEDYRGDIHFSSEIITRLADSYRKFRNTARYILSNLADFKPGEDWVPHAEMTPVDQWIVGRLNRLLLSCHKAYADYQFHTVYHKVNEFVTVDFSSLFADISKDRLYVDRADSRPRRSKQTAMYQILATLTRVIAPILSFTSEEIMGFLPPFEGHAPHPSLAGMNWKSVHLSSMPMPIPSEMSDEIEAIFDDLWRLREEVTKALEEARKNKDIGASLEASVSVAARASVQTRLTKRLTLDDVADALIVSGLQWLPSLAEDSGREFQVSWKQAGGAKCPRCWHFRDDIGKSGANPELCGRCAEVLK